MEGTTGDGPTPADRTTAAAYRERLVPSVGVWFAAAAPAPGCAAVVLPLGPRPALTALLVVAGLTVGILLAGSPVVVVQDGMLRAGRARVPVHLVGTAEVLGTEAMRRARGPELDARAFLCLRGWVPGGVRVDLCDPADPTPYWLLSSRSPRSLAAALRTARPPA